MLQPARAATLVAVGGMGKTALAVEALYNLPQTRFPDGIFFHTFYHQPQAAVCLERICRAFGREPLPDPAQAAGMALADRKALLVLDGAEQADDLRPILNVAGECGVLITTRRRSDAPNYQYFLELTPLAEEQSLSLLQQWGQECAADEAAGKAVIQITGGLPLAIRLVGRYLRGQNQSAGAYLAWLQTTPLEALEQGQRQLESVPLLLARSLEALPEATAQVLALMGVLAYAPLPLELLEPALGLGPPEERRLLAGLLDYGLLLRRQPGDPLLELAHPLVHTYASRRLSIPLEAPARLAEHLNRVFEEQTPQGAKAFPRLEQYRPHLLALQGWLLEREQWEAVMDITWALDDYLDLSGHWTERISSLQAGYQAAVGAENRYNQGAFLTHLGLAYADLGQVEQAIQHYQQALEILPGDRRPAALRALSWATWAMPMRTWARWSRPSSTTSRRWRSPGRSATGAAKEPGLGNLGIAYADLGQVEQAIEHYQQALEIAREIGDRRGEGNCLGNLGIAYADLGQVEQAIQHYQQALEIAGRSATGAARGLTWATWAMPTGPGPGGAGHRALPAGAGDRPGDRRPARRGQLTWATWALPMRTWARWSRPSSTTSRRWRSPGRSATGAAKGNALGNLGIAYAEPGPGGAGHPALPAGSWRSPARLATGAGKPCKLESGADL